MGESLAGGRQASAFPVLSAAIGHLEALVRGFRRARHLHASPTRTGRAAGAVPSRDVTARLGGGGAMRDRKSTRLNSSHVSISYAVFCLKKKNNKCSTR